MPTDRATTDRPATGAQRHQQPSSGDDVVVAAHDLRCSYGDYEAVRGIDLEVHAGELLALLGTNGAGKTTTMETLEGHRRADAGQVRVLGGDPATERAALRPRIGIMLQESGLAGDLTVEETVRLWLRLSSAPVARRDLREQTLTGSLEALDLADRRDTRVVSLSGGQKRRLDLVLATVTRPDVLFLDEPTTGLDPESRERAWAHVQQLRDRGTTVVLTTHYLEEAEQMADRLAIMHAGELALSGSIEDVLARQTSRITFRVPGDPAPSSIEQQVRTAVGPLAISLDAHGVHTLETDDLQTALGRLLAWADTHGHRLERLSASDASLAEVFHQISSGSTPVVPGPTQEAPA